MPKKFLTFIFIILITVSSSYASDVSGISMADTLKIADSTLVLNGAGIRTKFFIKLYACGLYLNKKSNDPEEIIKADEAMAIRMHMTTSLITASKMEKTIRKGFENSTGGNTGPILSQINEYVAVFKDGVEKNDLYDLIYSPGKGVEVFRNGEFVTLIEGLPFKQALFGIWLSERPAQKNLKMEMLGNS